MIFKPNRRVGLFLGAFLAASSPIIMAEVVGKSIATVNGEAVYLADYENNWDALMEQQEKMAPEDAKSPEWRKTNRAMLLDQMIEDKLLLQEANKQKVVVPKRQLEEGLLQVKNRFKNIAPGAKPTKEDYERDLTADEKTEFVKELKKQDLTEKEFEAKINDQLKVLRLTESEVRMKVSSPFLEPESKDEDVKNVTPEYDRKAKALYTELEKKFNDKNFKPTPDGEVDQMVEVLKSKLGEAVHARHILVRSKRTDDMKKRQDALAKIKALKKELDGGADFVELAKAKSDGPSAKNGGDLGFFSHGQMTPEFEKAAFALPVGGVSEPVETEFGYHIIMVEEKRAAKRLRYEDIKMDLAGYLFQKQMKERYEQYVAELRKKADVKVLIDVTKSDGSKG